MSSKLREALEKLNAVDLSGLEFPLDGDSSTIYNSNKKEITIPYWRVAELLNEVKAARDMAEAALAKPPRNCDLLSDAQEALAAIHEDRCYVNNPIDERRLTVEWLFDEAKGETDGSK